MQVEAKDTDPMTAAELEAAIRSQLADKAKAIEQLSKDIEALRDRKRIATAEAAQLRSMLPRTRAKAAQPAKAKSKPKPSQTSTD